jgi:hypothetical protein
MLEIKTGDTLLVSGGWWLARQIRRVTGHQWNHAGTMAVEADGIYVYESEKEGLIPTAWDGEKYCSGNPTDRKLKIRRYKDHIDPIAAVRFCKAHTGRTRYDFSALLHQIWFNLTGRWIGRTEDKAARRFYCSEWSAYFLHNFTGLFEQWWKVSPGMLNDMHRDMFDDFELN